MPLIRKYARIIYHFTDRSNLASIAKSGLLSWNGLQKQGYTGCLPGGNDWSHEQDARIGLDDYVHLCFLSDHPMCYVAKKDGRLPNPVWLQIDGRILDQEGVLYTTDVSNKCGVPSLSRAQANEKLDFTALYGPRDFANLAFRARFNKAKKSEILVPKTVPSHAIMNLNFLLTINGF